MLLVGVERKGEERDGGNDLWAESSRTEQKQAPSKMPCGVTDSRIHCINSTFDQSVGRWC